VQVDHGAVTDWQDEWRWRPRIVGAAAATPSRTAATLDNDVAVAQVAVLAGRRGPLGRAASLLDDWQGPPTINQAASRRLAAAGALLDIPGVDRTGGRHSVLLAAAATAAAAVGFLATSRTTSTSTERTAHGPPHP